MKPTDMSSFTMVPVVVTLMAVVLQTCSAKSVQIIIAQLGTDIILPCEATTQKTLIAVQWTRPDLTPELVLFHTEEKTYPEYQHPSFNSRVELLDKEMKNGSASLILMKLRVNDSGTYECRVTVYNGLRRIPRRNIESSPISIIRLTVTESGDPHDANEDKRYSGKRAGLIVGLFVVVPLVVVVVVLAVIYLKRQRTHSSVPTNPEGPEEL